MVYSKSNRLLFGQTNGQDFCTCHPYFDVYAKHTYIFNSPPPADKSDQQYSKGGSRPWHLFFIFVFLSGVSSQTLTIHSTVGEGRGPSFIPLYHFHPLTNIETFIFNFARSVYHMIHRFKEQNVGHSSLLKNEIFQTPILFAEEIFLFFLGDPRSELVRNPVENSISSQSFYYHGNFMKRIRTLRMRFLADLGIILGKTFPFLVLYIMNRGFLLWGNRKPSFLLLHNLEISKN